MKNELRNYAKFSVLGLEGVEVSEEDRKDLDALYLEKENYEKFNREDLIFETLSEAQQMQVFNEHFKSGLSTEKVTFLNKDKWKVVVEHCQNSMNLTLLCHFAVSKNLWKVSVERFIILYKKGEFHHIAPAKVAVLFEKVGERLDAINTSINIIEDKYNKLYAEKEKELKDAKNASMGKFKRMSKEGSSEKHFGVDLNTMQAKDAAEKVKGVAKVKSYWNSRLSPKEKAQLLGWLAANTFSINIRAVEGSSAAKTLKQEYGDTSGMTISPVRYNNDNERVSEDGIHGYVYFSSTDNIPYDIFTKVASATGRRSFIAGEPENPSPKRFTDVNFALFLVSEYSNFGFEPGKDKRPLYKNIDVEALKNSFESDKEKEAFDLGYNK